MLSSLQAREQYIYPGDKNSMVKWKLQVVLTKCDLVERFELARRIQVIKQKVSAIFAHSPAFYFSEGYDGLRYHVFYFFTYITSEASLQHRGILLPEALAVI
jgi:hypothetical protein